MAQRELFHSPESRVTSMELCSGHSEPKARKDIKGNWDLSPLAGLIVWLIWDWKGKVVGDGDEAKPGSS